MSSLARKRGLAREAKRQSSGRALAAAIGRTGQATRTTIALGDDDVELAYGIETAQDTSVTVEDQGDELIEAGDISDDIVDEMPEMTEDTWEAEDTAQIAADGADWVAEFATELSEEIESFNAELGESLRQAREALEAAGLARSEAAQAVADAEQATTDATKAINDALAAAQLAQGAAPSWATTAPTVADATGKPVGSIWYVRDSGGQVVSLWELTSLGWVQRPLSETVIPQVAIGSGTYGTLSGSRLVALSVLADAIAANAITAAKIAANAVTAVKIAANAVTAEKISAGAVATDKLDAFAVTAEKLAAGSVIADKIAANAITAAKIAVDALDGMVLRGNEIIGGTMRGGFFELLGYGSPLSTITDNMNVLTNWVGIGSGTISRDTTRFRSSTASIRVSNVSEDAGLMRTVSLSVSSGVAGSIWVYSPSPISITPGVRTVADMAQTVAQDVPVDTWTEVTFSIASTPRSGGWSSVFFRISGEASQVNFDDFRLSTVATDNRRLTIERDTTGAPMVVARAGGVDRFKLTSGGSGNSQALRGGVLELTSDTAALKSILHSDFLEFVGTGTNPGTTRFSRTTAEWMDGWALDTQLRTNATRGMRLRALGTTTAAKVVLETAAGDIDLNPGGTGKVNVNSVLVQLGDEQFTMSPSVGSGRIVITRSGRLVEIVYEVYTSFGTSGHTQIAQIPERFRPPPLLTAAGERRSAAAWFGTGTQYGSAALYPDGRLFVANTTGATRSEVNGSLNYLV